MITMIGLVIICPPYSYYYIMDFILYVVLYTPMTSLFYICVFDLLIPVTYFAFPPPPKVLSSSQNAYETC